MNQDLGKTGVKKQKTPKYPNSLALYINLASKLIDFC